MCNIEEIFTNKDRVVILNFPHFNQEEVNKIRDELKSTLSLTNNFGALLTNRNSVNVKSFDCSQSIKDIIKYLKSIGAIL